MFNLGTLSTRPHVWITYESRILTRVIFTHFLYAVKGNTGEGLCQGFRRLPPPLLLHLPTLAKVAMGVFEDGSSWAPLPSPLISIFLAGYFGLSFGGVFRPLPVILCLLAVLGLLLPSTPSPRLLSRPLTSTSCFLNSSRWGGGWLLWILLKFIVE